MSPRSPPTGSTSPKSWPPQDGEEAISINRHFVEHPDMVLGAHARTSSAYGPTYTCLPIRAERTALFQDLLAALHTLPARRSTRRDPAAGEARATRRLSDETIRVGTAAEGATIKEGSYLVVKDRLAQIIDGMAGRRSDPQRQGLGRHSGEACAHHPGPRPNSRRGS